LSKVAEFIKKVKGKLIKAIELMNKAEENLSKVAEFIKKVKENP